MLFFAKPWSAPFEIMIQSINKKSIPEKNYFCQCREEKQWRNSLLCHRAAAACLSWLRLEYVWSQPQCVDPPRVRVRFAAPGVNCSPAEHRSVGATLAVSRLNKEK